jgi:hypothetical protein
VSFLATRAWHGGKGMATDVLAALAVTIVAAGLALIAVGLAHRIWR